METKQLNLKLPKNLMTAAERYAKNFGFRNVQELAATSLREKIFEKNNYDENFSQKEIELIDELITNTIKQHAFVSEDELQKILLQ